MDNLKHFFLNNRQSKNLIYANFSQEAVPSGGEAANQEKKDFSKEPSLTPEEQKIKVNREALEAAKKAKLRIPEWAKEPEAEISKAELAQRQKRLREYIINNKQLTLSAAERKDFFRMLIEKKPNLDITNPEHLKLIEEYRYEYLNKDFETRLMEYIINNQQLTLSYPERKDFFKFLIEKKPDLDIDNPDHIRLITAEYREEFLNEQGLIEYVRKLTYLPRSEQNDLLSALKKKKPGLDITKKEDNDFVQQCSFAYLDAKEPKSFVAVVENVIQEQAMLAAARGKRKPSR